MVDVYQIVTDQIIDKLKAGVVPWRKPWSAADVPANLISKKEYRGINLILLGCAEYSSRYWLTFNQVKSLGGYVRRGEKSTVVVFWRYVRKRRTVTDEETGLEETVEYKYPLLRYYRVFNIEQCEGIPENKIPRSQPPQDHKPINSAEEIVSGYEDSPPIHENGSRAYYRPSDDCVIVPRRESFEPVQEFYSTLFHELVHSTGHESRLDRFNGRLNSFGSVDYAEEELVAEMGAAFLCGFTGIVNRTIGNSASYINHWIQVLKDDHKLLVVSAGRAQKAVGYIQGKESKEDGS